MEEKRKRENRKRNKKVLKLFWSLYCRGCTATVSSATEALKYLAKCQCLWFPIPSQLLVSLRKNCLPITNRSAMDLSHAQSWNIGWVTKISSLSSLSAVALDSVSVPASQAYNECIFSVSVVTSLLARETILRHHWTADCCRSQTWSRPIYYGLLL